MKNVKYLRDHYTLSSELPLGLEEAYKSNQGFYYDSDHKILYVDGSSSFGDYAMDVDYSLFGDDVLRVDPRYDIIRDMLDHHQVRAVASHSLGARVLDKYLADHPNKHKDVAVMFDSLPEITLGLDRDPRVIYDHRSVLDPISMGDLGATSETFTPPHSYSSQGHIDYKNVLERLEESED